MKCARLVFFVLGCAVAVSASEDIVNTEVDRKIDLTTHLVKLSDTITIENTGSREVRSYVLVIHPSLSESVSFIGAVSSNGEDEEVDDLTVSELNAKDKQYSIELQQPLQAGQKTTFVVTVVAVHAQKPYPVRVTQEQKQLVLFTSNLYFFSPYGTTTQSLKVTLPSANVQSHTQVKPVTKADKTITYGPFKDQGPFSEEELRIHFENNTPFLTVTSMTRTIELSLWGNIAVEEEIKMKHTGAELDGPFSRVDYQRMKEGNSIKAFKMVLPSSARDVYYRDEIGNISTSNMRQSQDSVEVDLRPRFPLFGGWKTHYIIGYNVPSWQYLYNKGDNYVLKMPFVDHVYDDQVIDELTVRIILPEGAKNVKLTAPYPVKRDKDSLHYTYLDVSGRPIVTARKTRLVEESIQDFQLSYRFSQLMLLREPLLVVGALYLFFFAVIVYVRLDFTITRDEAKEVRMKASSLIESVKSQFENLTALHQGYFDSIDKFKSTKDATVFQASRKKLDASHKAISGKISELQQRMRAVAADFADKVGEAVRAEDSAMATVRQAIQAAEKLIAGKMDKKQYIQQESHFSSNRDESVAKAEAILAAL